MAISSTSNIDEYCAQYVYFMCQDASDQVLQVSGEAVKFVSGRFTGPFAFHSATVTLEDCTLCGHLRMTDSVVHLQALFLVAIIKRDVVWAGSPETLPMLATWSQSNLHLAEDPCDEGDLRHLFGLVVHNLVSIIDNLRGERRWSSCQSF